MSYIEPATNKDTMRGNRNYVVMVSMIVALGGFLMGFDASVISGVVKFIEPQFDLTKIQLGWAVSCLTLTATLAMLVSGPVSDRIGRKKLLSIAAILYSISAIFSALAPSFFVLVTARMIGGLGVGASLITAPMYIAEISPPKVRGRMVSFNQLNIVIGISVAFFTNFLILKLGQSDAGWAQGLKFNEHNWRWMLGLEILPAILYFFSLFAVPESPRWLIMKNRVEEALTIMTKASGEENARKEMIGIEESIRSNTNREKVSILELFKPAMKLVLVIGIIIAILQQITGINSVFFYAPMIFEQSGIGTNAAFSQAILVGITNLVFTIVAMWLVDRLGRKPLLIIGLAGIVVSMSVLAYGFNSANYTLSEEAVNDLPAAVDRSQLDDMVGVSYESDLSFKKALVQRLDEETFKQNGTSIITAATDVNPTLILVGIIGFVAFFAISLGPVMWILFSELFPNRLRGLAISFAGFVNSSISFLVQLVFPWELANIGNAATFLIYGLFALVGFFFVLFLVPETKGKSLEELEEILVRDPVRN